VSSRGILPGVPPGSPRRFRSFEARYILFRAVFTVIWTVLARWTPAPLHGWRRLVLVAFGARIDRTARVYPHVRIFDPRHLHMGAHSVIGRGVYCFNVGAEIVLEPYADIAWGATLVTASHDLDSPEFQTFGRRITICSHAWVAAGACVGPGVTIGEGAVLSAWGVAFRDLAPWTIHYGNPAQKIRNRKRFDAPGLSTPDLAEADAAAPPPAGPDA
jgi:putative colanic acid biosynthesis acetyltransferase WcaF